MKWIREPLVHFTVLGAVLFLAYAVASDLFAEDQARQIVMDEPAIELLADGWQRQWQRPPTAEELRRLVDARVREEVLYREAQALGLHRDLRTTHVGTADVLARNVAHLVAIGIDEDDPADSPEAAEVRHQVRADVAAARQHHRCTARTLRTASRRELEAPPLPARQDLEDIARAQAEATQGLGEQRRRQPRSGHAVEEVEAGGRELARASAAAQLVRR